MDLRLAIGAAAAAALALALPGPALADDVTCAQLQAALTNPAVSDIHITEADCPAAALTIPAGRSFTLTGAPTTFHGNTGGNPIIDAASTLGNTSFSDLTFRDATVTGAGSVDLAAGAVTTIQRVQFLGNTATGPQGAGLEVLVPDGQPGTVTVSDSVFGTTAPGEGNSSAFGAGLELLIDLNDSTSAVTVQNSSFGGNSATGAVGAGAGLYTEVGGNVTLTGNTFTSNTATGDAGGAFIAANLMTLTGNSFIGNSVNDPSTTTSLDQGGGLQVSGLHANGVLQQTGNLFQGNSVKGVAGDPGRFEGAGELVRQSDVTMRGDRFIGNQIIAPATAAEIAGAGFFDDECAPVAHLIQGFDLVVAGNSIATPGEGSGIYVGCGDMAPRTLQLFDSTVSGNSVGAGGSAGVAGDLGDALVLRNSIVAGNSGPDVDGFGTVDSQFSDACGDGGAGLPGAGNICVDPRLTNAPAGDITQTVSSPTRDVGSNALVPPDLTTDAFGAPRIQGAAVDMGAQEFPAPAPARDTTPPGVSGFGISHKRFRIGSANTPVSAARRHKAAPKGTRIRWTSSEAATARLHIQRVLPGRKVKRKGKTVCVKPKRSLKHKKRCNRFSAGVTLTRTANSGRNSVAFSGRVRGRALKVGRYRVSLTETDAAGNRSRAKHLSFTIVKH